MIENRKLVLKSEFGWLYSVIRAFEWILNVDQVYFIQKLTQRTKSSTEKGEFSNADKSFNVNRGFADVVKEVKDTKTVTEVDATSALLIRAIHAALSPLEK